MDGVPLSLSLDGVIPQCRKLAEAQMGRKVHVLGCVCVRVCVC